MAGHHILPGLPPDPANVPAHHEEALRQAQGLGGQEVSGQKEGASASGGDQEAGGRAPPRLRPRLQFYLPEVLSAHDGEV